MPIYWTPVPYLPPASRLFARPAAICESPSIANVKARLEDLARRYGERFRPDPGWQQFTA